MLTLRFARHGRKKQAFFKIVAAEKARAVQKKCIAELGFYDPLADGGKGICKVDATAVKNYIKNGAQVSQSVARLLVKNGINEAEKFIATRVTKPKKEAPAPEPKETEEPTAEADVLAEEPASEEAAAVSE
jgi:small subunit ribosomal protein S16